jgi:hypothetical protein
MCRSGVSSRIGSMIKLSDNQLRFTFPNIQSELRRCHGGVAQWLPELMKGRPKLRASILQHLKRLDAPAAMTVDIIRTLRLPNDGKIFHHPPGFSRFPLLSVDEHRVPAAWQARGGVMLPLGDAESLFFHFQAEYPVAIRITAGGKNVVSGRPWTPGLEWAPQDYLVQSVCAGFVAGYALRRQFEPLRDPISMTVLGGFLIELFPVRWHVVFDERLQSALPPKLYKSITAPKPSTRVPELPTYFSNTKHTSAARVALGGLYRGAITEDPRHINDYDFDAAVRCFVQPVDPRAWQTYIGIEAPEPVIFTDFRGDYSLRWLEETNRYRASSHPTECETCDVREWTEK